MAIFILTQGVALPNMRSAMPPRHETTDEAEIAVLRKACAEGCGYEFGTEQAAPAPVDAPVQGEDDLSLVSGVNKTVLAKLTEAGITTKPGLVEALKGRREEMQTLLGEDRVAKLLKSLDLQ